MGRDNSDTESRYVLSPHSAVTAIFLVTSALLLSFYIYVFYSFGGSILIEIINVAATAILTALLVILYSKQTEVQKSQEKLMEAAETPIPSIEEWGFDGNKLKIRISNIGGGVATKIRAGVNCAPADDSTRDESYETGVEFFPLNRIESAGGNNLASGDDVWFEREIKIRRPNFGFFAEPWEVIGLMEKYGFGKLVFQVQVSYSTLIDDEIWVMGGEIMTINMDYLDARNLEEVKKRGGTLILSEEQRNQTHFVEPEE